MNIQKNSSIINSKENKVLIELNIINKNDSNKSTLKNKRIEYFDWLRILGSFSVVIIHVSCEKWLSSQIISPEWKISNFYDSIARFGVPIFFMISGTIFLEKDISFGIILNKYIKSIYIKLLFWSFFYSLREKIIHGGNYEETFFKFLKGHFHLWYLFRICGLYLITPFLKPISKNEKLFKIFLVLHILFCLLFPNLIAILFYISKDYYNALNEMISKFGINSFLHINQMYYIFGFYLNRYSIKPLFRIIIYILGISGTIFTIQMTYYISLKKKIKMHFYNDFYFNIFFASIGIFIFFKYNFNNLKYKKSIKKFIKKLGSLTLGIYIIHPFVIEELDIRFKINTSSYKPLYSIPINSFITFLISLILAYIIKKIPFINQYVL
jgi:surface polysaccharide O-acyltransferase-like enzyme